MTGVQTCALPISLRLFNKADRIADRNLLATLCDRFAAVAISALDPATLPPLLEKLEGLIGAGPSPAWEQPPPEEGELSAADA